MVFFSHLLCLGRVNGVATSPPWCQLPPEGPTMAPAPTEGPFPPRPLASRTAFLCPTSLRMAGAVACCCSSMGCLCVFCLTSLTLPHTCNQFPEFNSLFFCSRMASVLLVGFQKQTRNQKSHGPLFQISGDRP